MNATKSEEELWKHLRSKKLFGKKFRRQHGIGPFIADFYCDEIKLIIELDGAVHDSDEAVAYDKERDHYFSDMGYSVIRFRNSEVMSGVEGVLKRIERHFTANTPPFMGESEGARI